MYVPLPNSWGLSVSIPKHSTVTHKTIVPFHDVPSDIAALRIIKHRTSDKTQGTMGFCSNCKRASKAYNWHASLTCSETCSVFSNTNKCHGLPCTQVNRGASVCLGFVSTSTRRRPGEGGERKKKLQSFESIAQQSDTPRAHGQSPLITPLRRHRVSKDKECDDQRPGPAFMGRTRVTWHDMGQSLWTAAEGVQGCVPEERGEKPLSLDKGHRIKLIGGCFSIFLDTNGLDTTQMFDDNLRKGWETL